MFERNLTFAVLQARSGGGAGLQAAGAQMRGPVIVDEAAAFLARFANGATRVFEVTCLIPGRRNHNAFEINGSLGSIRFDLERMNELEVWSILSRIQPCRRASGRST